MSEQHGSSGDQPAGGGGAQRDASSGANERRRARPGVATWDYMTWIAGQQSSSTWVVVYVNGEHERRVSNTLPVALAQAGAVGWDLVAVHPIEGNKAMYVFKRPQVED